MLNRAFSFGATFFKFLLVMEKDIKILYCAWGLSGANKCVLVAVPMVIRRSSVAVSNTKEPERY
jgi:hypothetical protein